MTDYTKEESINDRVADIYMTLFDSFESDPSFVSFKDSMVIDGQQVVKNVPGCQDINFSPIITGFLGLSSAKKAELDAFQAGKNNGNGLGISLLIWQLAERKATAESLKEVNAEVIKVTP